MPSCSRVRDRRREAREQSTRPAVAIVIVNQNDVRTTASRRAGILVVEVEAEERGRDAHAQHDHGDGGGRGQRLHAAERPWREIARVERQQQDREDPRDEAAEPVDHRMPPEPLELLSELHAVKRRCSAPDGQAAATSPRRYRRSFSRSCHSSERAATHFIDRQASSTSLSSGTPCVSTHSRAVARQLVRRLAGRRDDDLGRRDGLLGDRLVAAVVAGRLERGVEGVPVHHWSHST